MTIDSFQLTPLSCNACWHDDTGVIRPFWGTWSTIWLMFELDGFSAPSLVKFSAVRRQRPVKCWLSRFLLLACLRTVLMPVEGLKPHFVFYVSSLCWWIGANKKGCCGAADGNDKMCSVYIFPWGSKREFDEFPLLCCRGLLFLLRYEFSLFDFFIIWSFLSPFAWWQEVNGQLTALSLGLEGQTVLVFIQTIYWLLMSLFWCLL